MLVKFSALVYFFFFFFRFDLNGGNGACARLGGEVALHLGVVKEEVAVLVVLVRRHCCVVGAAARRAVDDGNELVFAALECRICAAFAKVQPAPSPLRMNSAFPNAGGAVQDTEGGCTKGRRLQKKFEWTELPAVLAEGQLRLHGNGVELAESVFFSDDTGTFTR